MPARKDDLDAPVLRPALDGGVRGERLMLGAPDSSQLLG
jgi:hypothetical protein